MAENDKASLYLKIAERAYSYYVKRGFKHGHDMEDWLKAEKEILAEEVGKKAKKQKKVK